MKLTKEEDNNRLTIGLITVLASDRVEATVLGRWKDEIITVKPYRTPFKYI